MPTPHVVSRAAARRAVGARCGTQPADVLVACADWLCERVAREAIATARTRAGSRDGDAVRVRASDVEAALRALGLSSGESAQSEPRK